MKNWETEINKKYGKLTVLSVTRENKITYAVCRCDCGKEKRIRLASLKNGNSTSCGCSRRYDMTGKRYGSLVVLEPAGVKNRDAIWKCRCDCGNFAEVSTKKLISGNTKSCGCGSKNQAKKALEDMADGTRIGGLCRQKNRSNTSGKVGVYYIKSRGKWAARIKFKGKQYFLGNFDKFEDACKARKTAEENIHKKFLIEYAKEHPEKSENILKKV